MQSTYITRLASITGAFVLAATSALLTSQAAAQIPVNGCQFKAAEVSKALGTPFNAGQGQRGIGPSCVYTSTDGKQQLSVVMFPTTATFDAVSSVIGPARTTQFAVVPNDANQARIVTSTANPNVAHVAYVRGRHLVQLRLVVAPSAMRPVATLNNKLLTLPRV
ncbi:MAG: hypothetical protein JNL19_04790 [Burkholderiales bacterium]|nr:hypothetical protein [Burkholderiales bacterium]